MISLFFFSFAFEAQTTCFIIYPSWQSCLPPCTPSTHPPPPLYCLLAKLSTNWFFLFPLSAFFFPSLILMLLGCGKYLFNIDRRQSWWVFHERQNSNCFCPTDVSKYQSPEGEVGAGLQIRAIKPQRPDSFSYRRIENRKKCTPDTNSLTCDGVLVSSLMCPMWSETVFQETNRTFLWMIEIPE